MEIASDVTPIPADTPSIPSGNGRGKLRLLTRHSLDGRTRARKQYDGIVRGIVSDLGGEGHMSTIQKVLTEAFAGIAVQVGDLNAKLLGQQEVDLSEHSQAVSALVRVASRLPINRVPKTVTTFGDLIRADQEAERERLARERAS